VLKNYQIWWKFDKVITKTILTVFLRYGGLLLLLLMLMLTLVLIYERNNNNNFQACGFVLMVKK